VTDVEPPDAARLVRERIMTGLRIAEGLDIAAMLADAEAASPGAAERLDARVARFAGEGLIGTTNGRWMLTDAGFLVADFVAAELMGKV